MHPDAAETATLRHYLDWMVSLPWSKGTKDNLDLIKAQKILDEDHYGLEKIKERIIEHLAVRKLKKHHVLHGGEEYELLIIASDLPKSIDGIPLTRIGEIINSAIENQAYLIDGAGESVLVPRGWQHFA